MTLLAYWGFDSTIPEPYTGRKKDAVGRFGTGGCTTTISTYCSVPVPGNRLIIGGAHKITVTGTSYAIMDLREGSTIHLQVYLDASGFIQIKRNGVVLATSTYLYTINVWHYLEVKAHIDDLGSVEVRVDGNTALTYSGDTQNGGAGLIDEFRFDRPAPSGTLSVDDVYVASWGDSSILVDYGASGWKYKEVAYVDATSYAAPGYDDSSWFTGTAAFGNNGNSDVPFGLTNWTKNTSLWLRRTLPEALGIQVYVYVEDNCDIYVNGTLIGQSGLVGSGARFINSPYRVSVPDGVLAAGTNVLAIRCNDEPQNLGGDATFADVRVTGATDLLLADPNVVDDFLGDVLVTTLHPNGNGAASDFTGSDGNSTDNYLLVGETDMSMTDFVGVGSSSPGARDLYEIEEWTSAQRIYAVQQIVQIGKNDAGIPPDINMLLSYDTSVDAESLPLGISVTPQVIAGAIKERDREGNRWSQSTLSALQIGMGVVEQEES